MRTDRVTLIYGVIDFAVADHEGVNQGEELVRAGLIVGVTTIGTILLLLLLQPSTKYLLLVCFGDFWHKLAFFCT